MLKRQVLNSTVFEEARYREQDLQLYVLNYRLSKLREQSLITLCHKDTCVSLFYVAYLLGLSYQLLLEVLSEWMTAK